MRQEQAGEAGEPPRDEARGQDERARTVRAYAEAVFARGRVPMEPVGFQPNWRDQPSKHKTYLGVPRLPLPPALPDLGPVADAFAGPATAGPGWTVASVAALLRLSYGVLERRVRVSWNQDVETRIHYDDALWGRATASGGGMYPLETYWVAGGSGPLAPGVYHYSTAHHALERLVAGDAADVVRGAVGDATGTDQFLVVAVRFWKNSYKYSSFCYHVVTQDLGALLGGWELIARGMGRPLRRMLWFADEPLNDLLGLNTPEESVLAVVPLPWAGKPAAAVPASAAAARTAPGRIADRPFFERSATVLRFEQVERVHRATLLDARAAGRRPVAGPGDAVVPAPLNARGSVALPAPEPGKDGLTDVLRRRRSSFGGFVAYPPLDLAEVGTVLAGATSAQRYAGDIKTGGVPLTRVYLMANRVDGLPSGTYAYEAGAHRLLPIQERDLGLFLQKSYFLTNYNLDQVGAVLAIAANLDAALARYGSRGYRVLNAEVGALAQTTYVAAGAAGVGCGAVLGFDNIAMDEALGLGGAGERTFLFLLLGHERTDSAELDGRLA